MVGEGNKAVDADFTIELRRYHIDAKPMYLFHLN